MKAPIRILVVDDNPDLLDTFCLILKSKGYEAEPASDGMDAVSKFLTHSFDVVLMDIIMPRMDGVEAFRRIRQISPRVKIILMTAYSAEEQLDSAIDEGAYGALRKPIDVPELIGLINEATAKPQVLVVDDDDDFCRTLSRSLEIQGYSVLTAYSGAEAVKLAREKGCHVALVDLKMPLMNGLETYLKLRQINSGLSTIIMTGYREQMEEAIDQALKNAAAGCLYKPFEPSQAMEMINRVGHSRRDRGKICKIKTLSY